MKEFFSQPKFWYVLAFVVIIGFLGLNNVDIFNKTFFSRNNLVEETLLGGTDKNIRVGVTISCPFDVLETPVPDKVIINEVAWMGTAENFNNEWIELKNISAGTVSISGWQLIDKDEQIKIIFPDSAEIPASGFYLLEKGEEAVVGIEADIVYTGNLRNSEENLRLFNDKCGLVDEVSANPDWPAGNNKSKNSMERDFRNFSWYTSSIVGGTPGNINSEIEIIAIQSPSSNFPEPRVLISEIMAGTEDNSDYEFIEFYNPGKVPVDLTGWELRKRTSSGNESNLVDNGKFAGIIPAQRFFLIASPAYNDSPAPDLVYSASSARIAYKKNSVVLYNGDYRTAVVVDEVYWDEIPKDSSFERLSWGDDQFIIQISPNPQGSN